jgi:quinol monooxygenase YgiN
MLPVRTFSPIDPFWLPESSSHHERDNNSDQRRDYTYQRLDRHHRVDGWISTSFIAAKDQRQVVIYSQWRDVASVEAMRTNAEMAAYFPRIAAIAAFNSLIGDVVDSHHV